MTHQKGKYVYYFGEGGIEDKWLLGGKGAGLSDMFRIGLPVPPGFTISTEACVIYQTEKKWPEGLEKQVNAALERLQKETGKTLGDVKNPLLVSVRSGAKISMPGMMDTVLNTGINEEITESIAKASNRRFAYDSYRRFIQMFGDVVMGVKHEYFEEAIGHLKSEKGVKLDTELTDADLEELVKRYKVIYKQNTGKDFPSDPREQLNACINAVFNSWNNPRAVTYRNLNNIPHDMGTAVNVQSMVFGNIGNDCGTGVAFTRNPSTGENARFGEYLMNAQGEDVVAGIRTPKPISVLKDELPAVFDQIMKVFDTLEKFYHDMQDVEFTVEHGKLFMLQTRNGKRTAAAALKIAYDMVKEGMINKEEAIMRLTPEQIDQLLHKQLDPKATATAKVITKGLPASPGAAVGSVVFHADDAVAKSKKGEKVILVRLETSAEDIAGMAVAQGVVTARGGMTSHAAVVARGMNVACITGCSEMLVDGHANTFVVGGKTYKEGDLISIDGGKGMVYEGKLPVVDAQITGEFGEFLGWLDEFSRLRVLANADTKKDATSARKFGAKGIGLCRTEHMFFSAERILPLREMICASDEKGRRAALEKLIPFQVQDFTDLLDVMNGLPVIVRLLDPPLHEFLPNELKEQTEVANALGIPVTVLQDKVKQLHEFNPMLGFRGVRVGVQYPEIYENQVIALFKAALKLKEEGKDPRPWVEIPLVGNIKEFLPLKEMVLRVAKETGVEGKVNYKIGSMIEVPRAALTADIIAPHAQFFSFGTNDLTQMTCGLSRDDSGFFLKTYVEKGIYKRDPFQSIDQEGVGILVQRTVALARPVNPNIDIGVCGEVGGDPESIEFFNRVGLDDVSCSPFRVPIARLAAAQAAIKEKRAKKN